MSSFVKKTIYYKNDKALEAMIIGLMLALERDLVLHDIKLHSVEWNKWKHSISVFLDTLMEED